MPPLQTDHLPCLARRWLGLATGWVMKPALRVFSTMVCSRSFGAKHVAGGDDRDEVSETVITFPELLGDPVHIRAIPERQGTSQGEGQQLVDHGAGELV